jgi:hypothetical protein
VTSDNQTMDVNPQALDVEITALTLELDDAGEGGPRNQDASLALALRRSEVIDRLQVLHESFRLLLVTQLMNAPTAELRAIVGLELQAHHDRKVAFRSAARGDGSSNGLNRNEGGSQDGPVTGTTVADRKTTELSGQTKKENSIAWEACGDVGIAVQAPCGHAYCDQCLKTVFILATKDEALWPPRCCQQAFPIEVVIASLCLEEVGPFEKSN